MATKAKYQSITLHSTIFRKSVVGMMVIADTFDPSTGLRKLVFERMESTAPKPKSAPKPAAPKGGNKAAPTPAQSKATQFPPAAQEVGDPFVQPNIEKEAS